MTTKQQATERRAKWDAALRDGRVVRNGDGMSLTSYPTKAGADAAVANQVAAGLPASIVVYPPQAAMGTL